MIDLNKRKIVFAYIPDYLFINDEKTPYGLLCLKEVLESSNQYTAEIWDYNLNLFNRKISNTPSNMIATFNMIAEELSKIGADAISFYTMCSNFYCCIPIARKFKEICPNTPCLFAGPHATCIAQNILEQYPFIDYVSMGEGEKSVLSIFDAIFSNQDFAGVNGIAFRANDEINIQWNRKERILGAKLPQIDLGRYFPVDPSSFITLEGGRGCPFSCTFCSTQKFWGNVFVVKPVEMLISEMQHYYSKYGANKFSISHDLFTANRQYILTFCQKVCELPFKVEWGCSSRLDVLDEELIAAMIRSGCTDIYIGIESGSQRMQKKISKNLNIDILCETLSLLLSGYVSCILSFIYGYPFEETEDIELTLQKIYEAKILESDLSCAVLTIQLHRLTFLPGTVIAEEYYNELEFEGINTMSYFDEDETCGYVIIKFVDNAPVISEFCIEEGAPNPYVALITNYGITGNLLKFYSIGANDYQIYDESSKTAYGFYDKKLSTKEFESCKALAQSLKGDPDEQFLNYSGLDGWSVVSDTYEGTVNSSKTITGAGSISYYCSSTVSSNNLTYACSIVALSNLMKYYRSRGYTSISSNFKTLYNSLWNHAGTSSDGSTTNGKEPKAAKKYLSEVGYSCSYSSFKAYSKFVSNLDSNKPCLFTYGAKFGDHKGGHAVFVAGYVDTSSYQYLKIADGWNSYLRYINFNGYSYSRKNGWAFTISG